MPQGWVKIHRQIKECWIWEEKPFDRTHAWIDLLLRANHQDKKVVLGKEFIEVKRGSFITSELKLMESWGWSKTKLRNFLNLLKEDGMIEINTDKKKTTINIVNYDVYQGLENQEKTTEEPPKDQEKTIKEPKKDTNKNEKNDKNEKKIKYAEYVSMTQGEYEKLVAEHGPELVKKMINVLDNYKGANGKKYKSDYRAILTWVVNKVKQENKSTGQNSNGFKVVGFDGPIERI